MLRFELGRLLLVLEYTRALIHAQFSLGWRCLLTSIDENDDGSSAWAVVRWLLPLGACSRLSEPEEEVPEGCALRKDICSSERERKNQIAKTHFKESSLGFKETHTHTHTRRVTLQRVPLHSVASLHLLHSAVKNGSHEHSFDNKNVAVLLKV